MVILSNIMTWLHSSCCSSITTRFVLVITRHWTGQQRVAWDRLAAPMPEALQFDVFASPSELPCGARESTDMFLSIDCSTKSQRTDQPQLYNFQSRAWRAKLCVKLLRSLCTGSTTSQGSGKTTHARLKPWGHIRTIFNNK